MPKLVLPDSDPEIASGFFVVRDFVPGKAIAVSVVVLTKFPVHVVLARLPRRNSLRRLRPIVRACDMIRRSIRYHWEPNH